MLTKQENKMIANANKVSSEISIGRILKKLFIGHFIPLFLLGIVFGITIFNPCSNSGSLQCTLRVHEWLIMLSGGIGLVLLLAGLASAGLVARICIYFVKKYDFNSPKVRSELIDLIASTVYCPIGLVLLYICMELSNLEILFR